MSEWWVSLWDRRAGGRGEQDMRRKFVVARGSNPFAHLKETAGSQVVTSDVQFTLDPGDDYIIDSFCELWAGWRDPDTLEWDTTKPVYGGWITWHKGHFEAGKHLFDCTLSHHNMLFDRTEIISWPTPIDDPPLGYPGASVRDWLISTTGEGADYDGVIPAHFQHYNNGGVDPVFDAIMLGVDGDYLPAQGDSEIFGHFGFMSVRALLDEIVKVARAAALAQTPALDVKPVYFWQLIPVGTALVPRFCFIDQNSQDATVDDTYSSTPNDPEGSLKIEYPYEHTRNAQPVRTRVTVKGEGADEDGIIWFSYLKTDYDALYPTYYQKVAGWAGAPINESTINQRTQAERYATSIGDSICGPEGQISFYSRKLHQLGQRIALYFPADGQTGQVYPLIDHEINMRPGSPIDHLVLGQRSRGLEDFLVPRPDAPMPLSDAGAGGGGSLNASAAGIGRSGAQVAGTVKARPVVNIPEHSDQNVVKPRAVGVVGQTWQATANVAPAVGDDPVLPVPLTRHRDTNGIDRDWTAGEDGTGHPQHYVGHIKAADFVLIPIVDPGVLREYHQQNSDGTTNTGVTVTFKLNGSTVSPPSVGSPLSVARDDVLTVTWAGTFPADGIAITLSERWPV